MFPTDVYGMLDVAETLTNRLVETQSREDLFGAILATLHVVDWDPAWRSETEKYDSERHASFRRRHPEWEIFRQIGNGMKHARKRGRHVDDLTHRHLEWEDFDFWENVGFDVPVWFVEMDGRDRAVTSVAMDAIRKFRDELSSRPTSVTPPAAPGSP